MQSSIGQTPEEAIEEFERAVRQRCLIAFAAGCRLAVKGPIPVKHMFAGSYPVTIGHPEPSEATELCWDFVVLGPGEAAPPDGHWTIYEDHSGQAVGRSA